MTHKNQPVTIYISAASDLMEERETLARMIATLPVTLAWKILQTPVGDERFDPTLPATADWHVLIMGGDIRAPVGSELYAIRRAGRPTVAFLKKEAPRTSAGLIFVKDAGLRWRSFSGTASLRRQVQQALAEHLLSNAIRYALTPEECARLTAMQTPEEAAAHTAASGTEAGHSAVVLSQERFTPSEGVIVDEQ